MKFVQQKIYAKNKGLMPPLPQAEILIYLILWMYAVFRGIYTAYRYALDFKPVLLPQDFSPGWSFVNHEKDNADYEWTVWAAKFIELIPWILCHIIISLFLWWKAPQWIPSFYIFIGSICVASFLGWIPTFFLLFQPVFMFIIHFTRLKSICWIAGLLFLVSINVYPFTQFREFVVQIYSKDEYILSVIMAWTNIRCLSFCLHRCDHPRKVSLLEDFLNLIAFCFYLPLLFTGPLMMFNDFENQMQASKPHWTIKRLIFLSLNVLRYIFWYIFNEVILHHVYIFALGMNPHLVAQMSSFGLCGLAYFVSQFFMIKYCVMYGLPGVIAQIENYQPPSKPKCVARIHLYSDMWRYFDRGLYNFLKRYIYIPIIGNNPSVLRKLLGSAACFSFIYIWHGTAYYIFLWSFLNFIGIVLEVTGSSIASTEAFKNFEEKNFSPQCSRRIKAIIITPLIIMSTVSNFYFLLRYDVAHIVFKKVIVHGSMSDLLSLWGFMYCMCQFSIEVKNWELRKYSKSKANRGNNIICKTIHDLNVIQNCQSDPVNATSDLVIQVSVSDKDSDSIHFNNIKKKNLY